MYKPSFSPGTQIDAPLGSSNRSIFQLPASTSSLPEHRGPLLSRIKQEALMLLRLLSPGLLPDAGGNIKSK
jgi:hypothetical protein